MYGASIEQDFPHIAFEQEQLRRQFELHRLFEANQPQPQRARRSLADILGQLASRIDVRIPGKRSPVAQS